MVDIVDTCIDTIRSQMIFKIEHMKMCTHLLVFLVSFQNSHKIQLIVGYVKFNIKQFMTNDFEIHKICDLNFQISFILNKLNMINFLSCNCCKKKRGT